MIRFGREICGDLAAAERREWWIGNGSGAYAAGTIALSLTRRYHGLLIAPTDPPLGRSLVLAKADAEAIIGDRRHSLFANRWAGGVIAPEGHLAIERFELDLSIPVWRFAIGACRIEQRIWMEPGADTTYIGWRLLCAPADIKVRLSVSLLANGRDHHGETWMPGFAPEIAVDRDALTMTAAGRFALRIVAPDGEIAPRRDWVENFDLPVERERGLGDRDHHLCIGQAEIPLAVGVWRGIVASLAPEPLPDIAAALDRRRAHDCRVPQLAVGADPAFAAAPGWVTRLVQAADFYVIARPVPGVADGRSVIAGYPWFGDWGRDTMIALPGLCLATGRFADARKILETFARFVDRGMLPNMFPGAGGTPEYNTVDAALWYIEAWRAYVAATGDDAALEAAYPVLAGIVEWHQRGTRYGIMVDPADGLLRAGEPGQQLTWMDARVDGREVTPRIGKPVEINALWYNALVAMAGFAVRLGQAPEAFAAAAERVRQGFRRFAKPEGDGLFDVIDGPDGDDPTVRPNQLFAVCLPASPLDDAPSPTLPHQPRRSPCQVLPHDGGGLGGGDRSVGHRCRGNITPTPPSPIEGEGATAELGRAMQRRVLEQCGDKLLTSYGLRSLATDHPDYRGHYRGGVAERDGGYHQGPAWGWLLGHWALAHYRVHGDAVAAQAWLHPIGDHLADAGLGQVSEIFDGDPPHRPCGAPAQAWSVACVLEAWWRLERAKSAATAGRWR